MKNISEIIISKAMWKYDNSRLHVRTLESGLHSDLYMNTDYIISDVLLVEKIVKNIFLKEIEKRNIKPDWIIHIRHLAWRLHILSQGSPVLSSDM